MLVVEHDEDAIRAADHLIDMGPAAGVNGGHVVAEGTPAEVAANPKSLTGDYLSGRRRIEVPPMRRPVQKDRVLRVVGARGNNLKNVDRGVSAWAHSPASPACPAAASQRWWWTRCTRRPRGG